ncbi:carboxymuconolactone decarboxylase family protein [Phenylobacterium deserti]|uniref:Alkyl hydroperoxide reductase AhpD n=1 Tax=Phenylobacterium deserti TaxID=1914756 RepID=A0A328AS96_9CAUL|nr:carboxymuconolactone decarboxylase family protein [Phenylobacterium deserti]RAK57419.1 alkyl hydroperoxide reductase [Phenylobacterium deserti]
MSIERHPLTDLAEQLPAYARDLALNLNSLAEETTLNEVQKWGCFVASAHAGGVRPVIAATEAAARKAGLSQQIIDCAKSAAAISTMNNIYYRSTQLLSNGEYRTLPSKLRMSALASCSAPKADFELWSAAVSAIHGCGLCLDSHESELRRHGAPAAILQAALRIAAVMTAVSRVAVAEGCGEPQGYGEAPLTRVA